MTNKSLYKNKRIRTCIPYKCIQCCLFFSAADCLLPSVTGPCRAAFELWYYDTTMSKCLPFTYGGCGGNANRFQTMDECSSFCNHEILSELAETTRSPPEVPSEESRWVGISFQVDFQSYLSGKYSFFISEIYIIRRQIVFLCQWQVYSWGSTILFFPITKILSIIPHRFPSHPKRL